MKESLLYKKLENNYVQCQACIRECTIKPEQTGFCGNRKNNRGELEDRLFPNIIVIDKNGTLKEKPILYLKDTNGELVSPNTKVFSVGGYYCNLNCLECPNPSMSHPNEKDIEKAHYDFPGLVSALAKAYDVKYIALTYNEFIPFPETTMELVKKSKTRDIETILVTNTTFTKEFIEEFYKNGGRIARLDLKASIKSGNNFYKQYCGLEVIERGKVVTINKILESIKHAKDIGLHIEILSAITPIGYVPSNFPCQKEFEETAEWIVENLGKETPWHLTLLRPKEKWIDVKLNVGRVEYFVKLAKMIGLENAGVIEKMCDCREGELFKLDKCCK